MIPRKNKYDSSRVKICGNCRKIIGEDKFCRYCGAEAVKTNYAPENEVISVVYGPPPTEREHICSSCGYTWKNWVMIDNERYCPKCGGNVISQETGQSMSENISESDDE